MDKKESIDWGAFYRYRKDVARRYRSIYHIEIRKKLLDVIAEELKEDSAVLDVGAFDRGLEDRIKKTCPDVVYKSMDIDRTMPHDYYSLDEIEERFDVIVMAEVIEHLEFEEGVRMLGKLHSLLVRGGRLIVTTPNIHHPNMWMRDAQHRTPYRFDVLGGALLLSGFTLKAIYRLYNDQFLRRLVRLYLMAPLHRWLDVDFAGTIACVAVRR